MSEEAADGLRGVRFVGPATAEVLDAAGVGPAAIRGRRVSYRQLTDAGVNPGVAAKLRREHSLPWTFEADADLGRRSSQIRGLDDAERAWVAASAGEWDGRPTGVENGGGDGDGDPEWSPGGWPGQDDAPDGRAAAAAAAADRPGGGAPEPVTELPGVDGGDADRLAEAGITSVRSLAAADPGRVAAALGLPEERVRGWHEAARER